MGLPPVWRLQIAEAVGPALGPRDVVVEGPAGRPGAALGVRLGQRGPAVDAGGSVAAGDSSIGRSLGLGLVHPHGEFPPEG